MKFIHSLVIIFAAALQLSWGPIQHLGMLTDDYGIVTEQDLAEEEERCSNLEPFPPKEGSCFQYWQCLPMKEFFIDCEAINLITEDDPAGQAVFWIKDGDHIHHYLTRRNFDLKTCHEWKAEWEAVVEGEETVCLSGEYIDTASFDEHPSSPTGTHYYWIIDRMKSRHQEWSYFYRGPKIRSISSN